MHAFQYSFPVLLAHSDLVVDPFRGVERLLAGRGVRAARVLPDQPPPELGAGSRVVAVTEWTSPTARQLLRQARRLGVQVVLVPNESEWAAALETGIQDIPALRDELAGRLRVATAHEAACEALAREAVAVRRLPSDPSRRAGALAEVLRDAVRGFDAGAACDAPAAGSHAARSIRGGSHPALSLSRMQLAPRRVRPAGRVAVNCVVIEDSPVGGVRTWANRLARGFADLSLDYHVRTLLVATRPEAWDAYRVDLELDELTDVCVIDPSMDQLACLDALVESIRNVAGGDAPAIVLPNYADLPHAAAAQLRCEGSGVVAIAHTDDDYYRFLARAYAPFEACVGVSRACSEWLAPIGGGAGRTAATIVYGVPVLASPRVVSREGAIQLAYVGRMVRPQKRIGDLLLLADELERLGTPFVLHMVGDGADLEAWRSEWETRRPRLGRVEFHGRRDPAWVQRFLERIDITVLVSEFEGTSISMLEGMGAGVVPAVTAVSSGVDEWVKDGHTGVTAPVGQPEVLARRIADVSRDRALLARLSRGAWERVRDSISIERMCREYAGVFDRACGERQGAGRAGSWGAGGDGAVFARDLGLRLHEPWRWPKVWCEDRTGSRATLERMLARAGYRRVEWNEPSPGCDAVVIDMEREPMTAALAARIEHWRREGLGVVTWPNLMVAAFGDARARSLGSGARLLAAGRQAVADGRRRLVVYGVGKHTRRAPAVFAHGLPFVGFMDDRLPAWEFMFGLPVVQTEAVMESLRPDAIILSSDAWEEAMWGRTSALRAAGVKVYPLYGTYEEGSSAGGAMERDRAGVGS